MWPGAPSIGLVLEVSGTSNSCLVTCDKILWQNGAQPASRERWAVGSTHTNTTVTSCSSASPPVQQAGDQGLEGPWRASAEATSRKMELGALRWATRLLTQAQRVLPSSGLDGFHSEVTTFTDLRGSLKTHHIVGYWGYFQQGGNCL